MFIVCHLVALPLCLLPVSELRDRLLAPFLPYIEFCGLKQNWTVFAPTPPQSNRYMTARVVFDDGSSTTWEFPRMEKMGLVDKMVNERFRKWANDYVNDPRHAILWPDTVSYVAGLHRSTNKRPISISVIRNQTLILLPGESDANKSASAEVLYSEETDAGELR